MAYGVTLLYWLSVVARTDSRKCRKLQHRVGKRNIMERAVGIFLVCTISGIIGGLIGRLKGFDFWESFGYSTVMPIIGWFVILFKSKE